MEDLSMDSPMRPLGPSGWAEIAILQRSRGRNTFQCPSCNVC